jgi:hypothetical protein
LEAEPEVESLARVDPVQKYVDKILNGRVQVEMVDLMKMEPRFSQTLAQAVTAYGTPVQYVGNKFLDERPKVRQTRSTNPVKVKQEVGNQLYELMKERSAQRSSSYDAMEGAKDTLAFGVAAVSTSDSSWQDTACNQPLLRLELRVGNPDKESVKAILDTGAEANVMTSTFAEKEGVTYEPVENITTTSYNTGVTKIVGRAKVRLYLGNAWIDQYAYVLEGGNASIPFLLGMPFFWATRMSFDYGYERDRIHGRMTFGNVPLITPVSSYRRTNAERQPILPISVQFLPVRENRRVEERVGINAIQVNLPNRQEA